MNFNSLFALCLFLFLLIIFYISPYSAAASSSSRSRSLLRLSPKSKSKCGTERWDVKTGTDNDAASVNLSPVFGSIDAFRALDKPSSLPADNRISPTEFITYQIKATLTSFKRETDSDYHLVLDDGNGNTIIGEIPSPDCVGSTSPFLSNITYARSQFDNQYTVTTSFQTVNQEVTVNGVAFFDFIHGQRGVAPNGFELHPILNIVFN